MPFTIKRKYITKRKRNRILRGGDVDTDAKNIIGMLKTNYTRQQVIDFLKAVQTSEEFKSKLKTASDNVNSSLNREFQFNLKSTCDYMRTLEKFVNELLTTSIESLGTLQDWDITNPNPNGPPIEVSLNNYYTSYTGNKNVLMKLFVKQYYRAINEPCLQVTGIGITPLKGGRMRRTKNRRLRRTQKGGEVVTAVLGVLAFIGFICFAIGVKLLESHLNNAERKKALAALNVSSLRK
jgi:hypothetical protein